MENQHENWLRQEKDKLYSLPKELSTDELQTEN